jgi:hypothetical protein
MRDEDLLKCPLLQGLDATHRSELLALINDGHLREKLEACLIQKKQAADIPPVNYSNPSPDAPQAEKKVHKWTPAVPTGRRCFKE